MKINMTARKADLMLLLLATFWGSGFTVTKIGVELTSPLQFLAFRFCIAAILSLTFSRRRFMKATKKDWVAGVMIGCFLAFAMFFMTVGLQYTEAGKAVFVSSAFVVMVPFFYWIFTGEPPKIKIILACMIMMAGLGMLSIGPNGLDGWNKGDFLVLLAAVGFALHTTFIGIFAPKGDPILLSGIQFVTAGSLFLLLGIFDTGRQAISLETVWVLVFSGVVITYFCFIIQIFCQKYTSPSHAAILINLETVFGSIIAIIFLGERYTPLMLVAFLIIFAAVLVAEVDWKELIKSKEII